MLFWPSLLMDGSLWSAQAARFTAGHRVILVDPPGHGASQPLREGFTFDECALSIVTILDTLNADRAHVIGNSWGGMIGATFAAQYPDRVGVSVLMNCTASPAGWRQRLEYGVLVRIARLLGGFRGPLIPSVLNAFLGPTSKRTRPDVVEAVRAAAGRADINSVRWAVESVVPRRPNQLPLVAGISTPVLVVAGVEDTTFPVAETRAMADAIPGAEFTVLAGAAHLAALECPSAVNDLIEAFLREHG
jgi:3-oxoadipate enol-lactonase